MTTPEHLTPDYIMREREYATDVITYATEQRRRAYAAGDPALAEFHTGRIIAARARLVELETQEAHA